MYYDLPMNGLGIIKKDKRKKGAEAPNPLLLLEPLASPASLRVVPVFN